MVAASLRVTFLRSVTQKATLPRLLRPNSIPQIPFSTRRDSGARPPELSSAIELVDSKTSRVDGQKLSNKQVAKLQRGLESPKKRLLTGAERGALDAESEDLMDLINEALGSSHFYNLFRNTGDTSKYVEIISVLQNQDRSHSTALWTSRVLTQFAAEVDEVKGREEALRFAKNASVYVTARLQSREPLFRSMLTKKMDFKRVPRLFFRPADDVLGLKDSESETDKRQQILREAGAPPSTKQRPVQTD